MGKFYVNTKQLEKSSNRLEGVSASVLQCKQRVLGISSNLSSIGIGEISGNLNLIIEKLNENSKKCNLLETSLKKICLNYNKTESNLTVEKLTINTDFYGNKVLPDTDAFSTTDDAVFNSIIKVDDNGNVTYDMDAILDMLSKPADEIPQSAYDAIAYAFVNMSDEDMEKTLLAMMNGRENHDYPWYNELFGPIAGQINNDYSSWTMNQDKLNNLYRSMNGLVEGNMYLINVFDQAYSETGVKDYKTIADNLSDGEYSITQKAALLNSLTHVDQFNGDYKGDNPTFDITTKADGSIEVKFNEYRNVGSITSPVFSDRGESTITIGYTQDGVNHAYSNIDDVTVMLHDRFADGFTADGFESDQAKYNFFAEHIFGYADGEGSNFVSGKIADVAEKIPKVGGVAGKAAGPVYDAANAVVTAIGDYETGKADAAFIDGVGDILKETEIYETFDCNVCNVQYDTADNKINAVFVEPGRYTYEKIDYYNNNMAGNDKITINDIVENPVALCENIQDMINNGYDDELSELAYQVTSFGM